MRSLLELSKNNAGAKGGTRNTDCHVGRWPPHNDIRYIQALGRTGGLPHQSADWFAMTSSIFQFGLVRNDSISICRSVFYIIIHLFA